MILPTKYVPAADSVLGRAACLIGLKEDNPTVSELWNAYRQSRPDVSFDLFTEALTLLFLVGLVDIDSGVLRWRSA